MKTTTLLITICFLAFIPFISAQNTGKKGTYGIAGGTQAKRQEVPKQTINQKETAFANSCYKNFAFSLKNYGYNKDGKFYSWGIKVKNNYSQAVQLKYKLIVGNDNPTNGTLTYYIKPGETYANDYGTAQAIIVGNNSEKYKIEVTEVCFEGQDCIHNGYVACGGDGSKVVQNKVNETVIENNSIDNISDGELGRNYFHGWHGYPKDINKAKYYFERASEQGNTTSMLSLALIYEFGNEQGGIPKNREKAIYWYKKACDLGKELGCHNYKSFMGIHE
jgi:TPR repeat protein